MSRKDVVTRISKENHERIKKIVGTDEALNARISKLLDMVEAFQTGEMIYISGGRAFKDSADAMGEAIVDSVRRKEVPEAPKVAIIIGDAV